MSTNSLPGNPHFSAANYAELEAAEYAQAQATLALAYEQRTANLLAAFAQLTDDGFTTILGESMSGNTLAAEITERLGL
jgi:hypothetical protein